MTYSQPITHHRLPTFVVVVVLGQAFQLVFHFRSDCVWFGHSGEMSVASFVLISTNTLGLLSIPLRVVKVLSVLVISWLLITYFLELKAMNSVKTE